MPFCLWEHIKDEAKGIRLEKFTFDGNRHQTGDAAFVPATFKNLQHSRANTDSYNSHNTQHVGVKQNALCLMQKDTQPSQAFVEDKSQQTRPKIYAGGASLLVVSIN
jgi:hypothetical protein